MLVWLGLCAWLPCARAQSALPTGQTQFLLPDDSVSVDMSLTTGDELQWSAQLGEGSSGDGETRLSVTSDLEGELWSKSFNDQPVEVRETLKIKKAAHYRITARKNGTRGRPINLTAWPKLGKSGRSPFPIPSVQKSVASLAAGDRYAVEFEFKLPDTTRFETILNLELPADLVSMWAVTPAGDSIPCETSVRRWFGESGTMSLRERSKRGGSLTLRLECVVPEGGETILYHKPGRSAPAWLPKEARVVTILEHAPWHCVVVPPFMTARAEDLAKETLAPKAKYVAQALRVAGIDSGIVADLTRSYEQRDSLYLWRRERLSQIAAYDTAFLMLPRAFAPPKLQAAITTPLSGTGELTRKPLVLSWFVEPKSGAGPEGELYVWQYDEAVLAYPQAPEDKFWEPGTLPLAKSLRQFSATPRRHPSAVELPVVETLRPPELQLRGIRVWDQSRRVLGMFLYNTSAETQYLVYRVERPIQRSTWAAFRKWPRAARWAMGIALVCAIVGGFALWELRQRDRRRRKQAEEMASELESARQVQQKLLPKGPMEVKGLQVLGLHQSMQSVGGDYYDFFPVEDGRVLVCVADVAGHGLPAALLMSNLQATLHAIAGTRRPVNEIVALLNTEMMRRTSPDRFVTLMLSEISADRSMITVCNAGHNPGYLVRKHGGVTELDAGGIMLGVMDMFPFIQMEYSLEPGDLIAFYTDGIPEAEIGFEDMFGYDRLQYFLSQNRDRALPEIAQKLFQRVTPENQMIGDDMAMVLVRVALGGGGGKETSVTGKAAGERNS